MVKSLLFAACLAFPVALLAQTTYTEVSLPELMKKKQQDPNIVIVDVRTDGEYYDSATNYKQGNIGRIKGAIHIGLQDLAEKPDAIKQLDAYKDKEVYLICSHSYRSRVASNILLKNGFTHVNNVRGGMTEWFRRYDELSPYRNDFYETSDKYVNLSPSQLYKKLNSGEKFLLIGIASVPHFFYDSLTIQLFQYLPAFKNVTYFNAGDSMQVLEKIKKEKPSSVVLFNTVNNGAAEMTDWLTQQGISNVSYLVGSENLFYEYARNNKMIPAADKFLVNKSKINFITPPVYCEDITKGKPMQLIDLRIDSLFNKVNSGTKYNFKHLKEAINFPEAKGIDQFMQQFPDKRTTYVFISNNGINGIELADALTKKGYTINWLIGGLQRYEWYMNNVETYGCMDRLVL
ncbi:MAG: rhodanese-like domain-containing protein [Chitinophagaceae bacterium]